MKALLSKAEQFIRSAQLLRQHGDEGNPAPIATGKASR
jgi:hypothetical protein